MRPDGSEGLPKRVGNNAEEAKDNRGERTVFVVWVSVSRHTSESGLRTNLLLTWGLQYG